MIAKETTQEIVESLRKIDAYKVILFGSYAYGKPHKDSDIDLLVVTSDQFIPNNFREKNTIYLKVAKTLRNIERKIPIDLTVHTREMHKKFIEMESMFSKRILKYGKVIYEKNN